MLYLTMILKMVNTWSMLDGFHKWEIPNSWMVYLTMILMLKMIQFLKRRLEIVEFPQAPKVSSELKTKAEWR